MHNVTILAIGHIYYSYWAWNLMKSIKYFSPDVKVTIIHDGKDLAKSFDCSILMDKEDYTHKSALSPCKAKLSLNKYLKEPCVYFDADSIILSDIVPFIEKCQKAGKYYLTEVHGWANEGDEEFEKMLWADIKDVWKHFDLKGKFPGTNSSFQYLMPGKELDKMYEKALNYFINCPYDYDKAPMRWGKGNDPDELYMNAAISSTGIDPHMRTPFYFPFKNQHRIFGGKDLRGQNELDKNNYYGMSYAGDGMSVSRFGIDHYNRTMKRILGQNPYPINMLLKRKFMRS